MKLSLALKVHPFALVNSHIEKVILSFQLHRKVYLLDVAKMCLWLQKGTYISINVSKKHILIGCEIA